MTRQKPDEVISRWMEDNIELSFLLFTFVIAYYLKLFSYIRY